MGWKTFARGVGQGLVMWRGGTVELELCWANKGVGEQSYLGFRMLTWPLLDEGVSTRGMGRDLSLIFKGRFRLLDMTQMGRRETTHV